MQERKCGIKNDKLVIKCNQLLEKSITELRKNLKILYFDIIRIFY